MLFEKPQSRYRRAAQSGDVVLFPLAGNIFSNLEWYRLNVVHDIAMFALVCDTRFENDLISEGDVLRS